MFQPPDITDQYVKKLKYATLMASVGWISIVININNAIDKLINTAFQRLEKGSVKYRFGIDMATLS